MVPALKSCITNGFWHQVGISRKHVLRQRVACWQNGDMLWETAVREGKGIGYWEKPNWKAASCAGLVSLLRSSENGMVCLQPLNGGEKCGSLSCHPEKGGQFWGRVIISNNSKGLSPALIYITCLSQKWSPIPLMNDPLTICLHEVHMWSKVYHT